LDSRLLGPQVDGDDFDMHPLVQLATRRWLEIHGKIKQRKEAFDLSHRLPNDEYGNWPVWEALEPHMNMVLCYDCVS
jgi:hypothetical protein